MKDIATGQVPDLLESGLHQDPGGHVTALADLTENCDRLLFIQLAQILTKPLEGNIDRSRQCAGRDFGRGTHVHQLSMDGWITR